MTDTNLLTNLGEERGSYYSYPVVGKEAESEEEEEEDEEDEEEGQ